MYVAVTLVVLGWALWYASIGLAIYLVALVIAFRLRVVLYEEPGMAERFPTEWSDYASRVRRWV